MEDTLWSLVIDNWKSYEFIHFNSMPVLKEAVAIDVFKRFYTVLNLRSLSLELANMETERYKNST